MAGPLDLFLSHHRNDAEPVRRLAAALEKLGVAAATGRLPGPGAGLAPELARAKVVLAWASGDYFRSRICQTELAAAYVAGSRQPPTAPERLLLINAEPGVKHIYPTHLRDLVIAPAPGLPEAWDYEELADSLRDHCEGIARTLGEVCPVVPPPGRGAFDGIVLGGPRFEGRERELWDIHDALHPPDRTPAALPVVVSAGSGQGKSALAREYAFRFGPAYPGGVFWLSAATARPMANPADLQECPPLRLQLAALLRAHAPDSNPEGLDVPGLAEALGARLAAAGRSFLWVVDDLPDRLNGAAFRLWLAPPSAGPLGRSLVLTRANRYHQRGTVLHLPPLDPPSALRLLTRDAEPVGEAEREAVAGLLEELGRQPMGLAVAGELAQSDRRNRHGRYAALWRRLDDHGPAAEDLAARLPETWPRASEVSIASVLLHALETLEEPGRDLLRLATILPDAGLPLAFATACLARSGLPASGHRGRAFALLLNEPVTEPLDAPAADAHARSGAAALARLCFGERTAKGIRVHPLAARAFALTDPEPARSRALERAVLDVLQEMADPADPAAAWEKLAPLSAQARRLAMELPAATDAGDDPGLRNRRLRLCCVLAELDLARGATGEALAAYRSAAGQLLRAMTEEPGNGRRQRDFAVVQERLGELLEARGDLSGALDCFRKSLGIRSLATSANNGSARPGELLRHHERIGALLERLGDREGALQSYRAAHAFLVKRASRKDADAERRYRLAASLCRLAALHRSLDQNDAAEAALLAASPILARLAAESPDQPETRRLQGDVESTLGEACLARQRVEEAGNRFRAALDAVRFSAEREPECRETRRRLGLCHDRLGNALTALNDRAGAAEQFRAYIALTTEPDGAAAPPRELAVAHIKLGIALEALEEPDPAGALTEYGTAAALLEQLAAADPKNPQVRKDRAWVDRRIRNLTARARGPARPASDKGR